MPATLFAFANDWGENGRYLRGLLDEAKAIRKALAPLVAAGLDVPDAIHNARVDEIIAAFREWPDQVCIFHFGGHANSSAVLFDDDSGQPAATYAGGLAGFLGQQRNLVLVFLNGCCTEPQVRQLRQAGVKAVVATTRAIQDRLAATFAEAFYAELARRPLRDAFDAAVHAIQMRCGDDPRAVTRDVGASNASSTPAWPWIIDCDAAYAGWKLTAEVTSQRRWRRALAALAAASLVIATSLLVGADARRGACAVPGLRQLCAAVGVGNVPSADEQARWDKAIAQRSGDGLREYLRRYPDGAYVTEANVRLNGCMREPVETLGQQYDYSFSGWPVPRDGRFPTKHEAQDDAMKRGRAYAEEQCQSYKSPVTTLVSAAIEQGAAPWECSEYDHLFACGFSGTVVCRTRDRVSYVDERCNGWRE